METIFSYINNGLSSGRQYTCRIVCQRICDFPEQFSNLIFLNVERTGGPQMLSNRVKSWTCCLRRRKNKYFGIYSSCLCTSTPIKSESYVKSPCNIVLSVLDLCLVIVVPTMNCVGQLSQTNSSMIVHRIGAAPDSVIARLLRHEYLRSEDHGMIRSFIPD